MQSSANRKEELLSGIVNEAQEFKNPNHNRMQSKNVSEKDVRRSSRALSGYNTPVLRTKVSSFKAQVL